MKAQPKRPILPTIFVYCWLKVCKQPPHILISAWPLCQVEGWSVLGQGEAGSEWNWEEGRSYHHILNPLSSHVAQHRPPQFCTHLNTGTEPRRPIAMGYGLPTEREKTLSSPKEISDGILARPGSSSRHFGSSIRIGLPAGPHINAHHLITATSR